MRPASQHPAPTGLPPGYNASVFPPPPAPAVAEFLSKESVHTPPTAENLFGDLNRPQVPATASFVTRVKSGQSATLVPSRNRQSTDTGSSGEKSSSSSQKRKARKVAAKERSQKQPSDTPTSKGPPAPSSKTRNSGRKAKGASGKSVTFNLSTSAVPCTAKPLSKKGGNDDIQPSSKPFIPRRSPSTPAAADVEAQTSGDFVAGVTDLNAFKPLSGTSRDCRTNEEPEFRGRVAECPQASTSTTPRRDFCPQPISTLLRSSLEETAPFQPANVVENSSKSIMGELESESDQVTKSIKPDLERFVVSPNSSEDEYSYLSVNEADEGLLHKLAETGASGHGPSLDTADTSELDRVTSKPHAPSPTQLPTSVGKAFEAPQYQAPEGDSASDVSSSVIHSRQKTPALLPSSAPLLRTSDVRLEEPPRFSSNDPCKSHCTVSTCLRSGFDRKCVFLCHTGTAHRCDLCSGTYPLAPLIVKPKSCTVVCEGETGRVLMAGTEDFINPVYAPNRRCKKRCFLPFPHGGFHMCEEASNFAAVGPTFERVMLKNKEGKVVVQEGKIQHIQREIPSSSCKPPNIVM